MICAEGVIFNPLNYNTMKLTVCLLLICTFAYSQHMTYEDTQNIEIAREISNNSDLTSYVSSHGTTLKIGDRLIFGKPSTNTNQYTCCWFGKVTTASVLVSSPIPLAGSFQAEEVVVDRIAVYRSKMNKNTPLMVAVYVSNPNAPAMAKNRTIFDYEKAIQLYEVINPNQPMSRDEAIAKLKEAKDLLDLGIIDQKKYDSLKAAYTPLIIK